MIDKESKFLQKSIGFNMAKYSFDEFFGLKWEEK